MRNDTPLTFPVPVQRDLLRRVAHGCLVSCFLALEPANLPHRHCSGDLSDFGWRGNGKKNLSHCDGSPLGWQAKMSQHWLNRLQYHKLCFLRALGTANQHEPGETERVGFALASALGLLVIPIVAFRGQWDFAVQEAAVFLSLLGLASKTEPFRNESLREQTYLKLLAGPVLWAVLFTHPEREEQGTNATAAAPLRRTQALADLFSALDQLADLPLSVCLAAGARWRHSSIGPAPWDGSTRPTKGHGAMALKDSLNFSISLSQFADSSPLEDRRTRQGEWASLPSLSHRTSSPGRH